MIEQNGEAAAVLNNMYIIDEISRLIEPLYADIEGFTLWIYAKFIQSEVTEGEGGITYENLVYSNVDYTVSEEIFDELMENIFEPTVVKKTLNGD